MLFQGGPGLIGRAILDNDDLGIRPPGCLEDRPDAAFDEPSFVSRRDDRAEPAGALRAQDSASFQRFRRVASTVWRKRPGLRQILRPAYQYFARRMSLSLRSTTVS